jgi:flagellar hook-length control protein FliK
MLKPLSAASAPLRSVSAEPVAGSDPLAPASFGDALETAQQAAQQAARRGPGNAQASRPAAAGTPTAPPKSASSTVTPPLDTPTVTRGSDAEPANGLPAARSAGVPVRSRDREDPDASSPAKPTSDGRPDASAAAEPAATPAVTPDPLAAAVMQAVPGAADPPDVAVGIDAGGAQSTANPAAGFTAERGTSTPSPTANPDVAAAPNNAAGGARSTTTSPAGLADAAQSLLSETIALGTPGLLPNAQPSVAAATPKASVPAGAASVSSAAAAAAASSALSPPPNRAAGTRPSSATAPAGQNSAPADMAQQTSGASVPSVSTLVETIRRTTGIEVDRIAVSTGSAQAAPAPSIDAAGTPPVDQAPVAAIDAVDPNAPFGALDGRSPLAAASANASLVGTLSGSTTQRDGSVVTPMRGQDGGGTTAVAEQAVDPQAFAIQAGDLQTTQAGAAGAARPLPANGGVPPSVASQVAPAVVSMAQGGGAGGRLSVSITPEQLGQVHITVERAADGTTSIHVAAEQLGTLNILRDDQAGLTRALDQAGVGQDGHSLSFSWEGGGSGTQGWNTPNEQRGEYQPANVSKSYAVDSSAIPSAAAAAARGGIDLTA